MIKLINISKKYVGSNIEVEALKKVSINVKNKQFVSIVGASGCGKTTLLNILAGFDYPDSGMYLLDNEIVNQNTLKIQVGMVFQEFHLLPYLNVMENVCLPLYLKNKKVQDDKVKRILNMVDLSNYGSFFPNQLSGGQRQRVAIARVLASQAKIILADEPTGALDKENSQNILKIFKQLQHQGLTIIMVTHDEHIALQSDYMIRMDKGRVVSERNLVSS